MSYLNLLDCMAMLFQDIHVEIDLLLVRIGFPCDLCGTRKERGV